MATKVIIAKALANTGYLRNSKTLSIPSNTRSNVGEPVEASSTMEGITIMGVVVSITAIIAAVQVLMDTTIVEE